MKRVVPVPIPPPPPAQRVQRGARFSQQNERKTRYTLPDGLSSGSPVGFRTRVSLTADEAELALSLLDLPRPTGFADGPPPTDGELFDESSLGVLSARQSTNFRGHRAVCLGPDDLPELERILRGLKHLDAEVLTGGSHAHIVLCRPYRTPFTGLLTFIGHRPIRSLATVVRRAWRKWRHHEDDIPTIGYLTELHVGILADAMERASVLASAGTRRAQVHLRPFSGQALRDNQEALEALYALCGVSAQERRQGWRVALVAQVGCALPQEAISMPEASARRIGAAMLALRSERIQPGVNQEDKAPAPYQARQDMDVPEELTVMCGRAGYNAMEHWTGLDRELAKELLLLERVDVLSAGGKRRLREIRGQLGAITDRVVETLPKWADWPTGRQLSKNAARGKKAFALAGQRIYLVGADRRALEHAGVDFTLAVRAIGAACARGALVAEIMGSTEIPEGCDLLAGICLMAGPVNQNDVGKQFYGYRDLLADAFPDQETTSLLVWTLKAKTVADPIGNEEQLMNPARKGALVDLRCAPHEAVSVRRDGVMVPFRQEGERTSEERAFADVGNFVSDGDGRGIPGNEGTPWPGRDRLVWV
jgi:hypothetical protein